MGKADVGKQQRSIWTGSISFGLVHVPVRLFGATSPHDLGFHQYDASTKQRIEYRRVAGPDGKTVPYESIVKGYEVSKGRVVLIEPDELEALAPKRSRSIEIEGFVSISEIDPVAWDQTYYLAPADEGAGKTYELLRRALAETGKVGIGRFVMRTREHLATVRPLGDGLALETMFYADEIRSQEALDLPAKELVGERELGLAKQLVDALTAKWEHESFEDTYQKRVLELIEKKSRGEAITIDAEDSQPAEVVDLMKALQASLRGRAPANAPENRATEPEEADAPRLSVAKAVRRKVSAKRPAKEADVAKVKPTKANKATKAAKPTKTAKAA